jgi:glycosyltransferase involved in cell wall biosynthesis
MTNKLLRITTVPMSLKFLIKGQMLFMQQQGFEVLAVSADGKERDEVMQYEKVSHVIVPMTRAMTPVRDLICLFKLIRVITKYKPSIVHTHTPKAGLLGMMAAFICRVPLRLHTVAGLPLMESQGLKRKVLIFTEWLTYFCAHRVYPNSFGLYNFIIDEFGFRVEGSKFKVPGSRFEVSGSRFLVESSKFKVIGRGSSNGIDTTYFSRTADVEAGAKKIRLENNVDDSLITFSFVGRVVNDKGIEELLTAFDQLSKIKKVKLILVGPFEEELDPITEKSKTILKSNPHIIAAGFQNDVRPFIAASDIFVFPSYREGFPNVVMQACCLEVPCIVSDINGCNEIIDHGKTGLVVKPKDVNSLYEAMLVLTENADMRRAFGKRSREFVVSNFDQRYFWEQLLAEYQLTEIVQ